MEDRMKSLAKLMAAFIVFWMVAGTPSRPLLAQVHDQPPDRPVVPERPHLPDRPDQPAHPTPGTPPVTKTKEHASADDGAWIELRLPLELPSYWSEVEWLDGASEWNTVTGWRGYSAKGIVRWYVQPAQMGQGPFRWTLFAGEGQPLLIASEAFYLPPEANLTTIINVVLP